MMKKSLIIIGMFLYISILITGLPFQINTNPIGNNSNFSLDTTNLFVYAQVDGDKGETVAIKVIAVAIKVIAVAIKVSLTQMMEAKKIPKIALQISLIAKMMTQMENPHFLQTNHQVYQMRYWITNHQ